MPKEVVAASTIQTAIVEILQQNWRKEEYQKGHYASMSPTALRNHVRKHLGLSNDQMIRDKEWKVAIELGIAAHQIRQNPNQSLVYTPPA